MTAMRVELMDGEIAPTERRVDLASKWAFLLFCELLFLLIVRALVMT